MNDPNGPIYYQGWYHLFYQLNPFSDGDGPKYWGHVRSRDLATWERLPIALWPSTDRNEQGIWSGCCTINGDGQPMIFYTSVALNRSPGDHAEQWAALGDTDLIHWHKLPGNPVLSEALHGDRKIYEWRDPFIFHAAGKTFLVCGGNLNQNKGGQAVVNIYEAQNPSLTQWVYRGVLFQHPDADIRDIECPNFFQVGRHWVLIVSPSNPVQWFVGDFDPATRRFHATARGMMDYGSSFYAPNTMLCDDGRRILWGWVNNFPSGHGWNGCLTVPRLLSVSSDGQLHQEPVPQLHKLRGHAEKSRRLSLTETPASITLPPTNALEITADFDLNSAQSLTLAFQSSSASSPAINISFNGSELTVNDSKAPLSSRKLNLHLFLDHSVFEVFANNTLCLTKVLPPLSDPSLTLTASGSPATLTHLISWPIKTIW
jgi:beta-fructofuranosidase